MGRSSASALAPVLRSEALARVLASIFLTPESLHVRAIADRAAVPYSTAQREIDRLEEAGLVTSVRQAGARVARPNPDHLLYPDLRSLLMKAYGPQFVLAEVLRDEPSVSRAFVFGSWADRYHGNWGGQWGDVDIALIGKVEPVRVEELEAEAEDRLGIPAHVVAIDPQRWQAATEPFIRTVRSRPLVEIDLGAE